MREIPDQTIDLILSDPPYYANLPYSELADFYHVWLRRILGSAYVGHRSAHTPMQASLFAGKRTGDDREEVVGHKYTCSLTKVLKECYRVAKKDARLIFTYHHNSAVAWKCLGTALLRSGFRVRDLFPVRSEGRSGLHSYDGTIKWDSVFVCEKTTRARSAELPRGAISVIVREALSNASRWRQRIKAASLEFGDADQRSLACSFVLGLYSQRALQPGEIGDTLTAVLSQFDRRSCRADAV
jgi:adenine-specific DNA methylase